MTWTDAERRFADANTAYEALCCLQTEAPRDIAELLQGALDRLLLVGLEIPEWDEPRRHLPGLGP